MSKKIRWPFLATLVGIDAGAERAREGYALMTYSVPFEQFMDAPAAVRTLPRDVHLHITVLDVVKQTGDT